MQEHAEVRGQLAWECKCMQRPAGGCGHGHEAVSACDCRGKRGKWACSPGAAESSCEWTGGCECLQRTEVGIDL